MKKLFLLLALTATLGSNCVGMEKQPTKQTTFTKKEVIEHYQISRDAGRLLLQRPKDVIKIFQESEQIQRNRLLMPIVGVKYMAMGFRLYQGAIGEDDRIKLNSILKEFWDIISEIMLDLEKTQEKKAKEKRIETLLLENNIFVLRRIIECLFEFWRIKDPLTCILPCTLSIKEKKAIISFKNRVNLVLLNNEKLDRKSIQDMINQDKLIPYPEVEIQGTPLGKLQHRFSKKALKLKSCEKCGQKENPPVRKLKVCSRCQVVYYCCRKCQVADWKEHKKVCKNLNRKK